MDTYAGTSASRGGWREIERSVLEEAGPERGRRAGGGSGNCANPLGCRYGRCFGNAVAGAVGVAETAETPSDDSARGLASALRKLGNLLVPCLEGELRAGADAGRPACGHGLELGVEAHAFHAVDAVIAEDRGLPAAEAVIGHGDRDRHVDADHADLHAAGEG